MTKKKPEKERLLAVATVCISLLLAFGLAELGVRLILPYNSPDTLRDHSLEYAPAVYARSLLKPLNRLVDVDDEKAWDSKADDGLSEELYFISANGYRGPSFDVNNKANKMRIIVLGGSAVFDQNVWDTPNNISRTWSHQIEQHLQASGFPNVEVINAGIPGHTSADSLGRLISQLWTYGPDLILVYHGWNDMKLWSSKPISPEHPMIEQVSALVEGSNPFISYQGAFDRAFSHSQLYMKLRNHFYKWNIDTGSEGASNGARNKAGADSYSEFGPRQFRLNLEQIVSASHSIGARPILVSQATLAAPGNTDADIANIHFNYQNLSHEALIRAYDETYSIIEEVGRKTNTLVIDAAGPMNGNSEFFADHVHTSSAGSARLAKIVADGLAETLGKI